MPQYPGAGLQVVEIDCVVFPLGVNGEGGLHLSGNASEFILSPFHGGALVLTEIDVGCDCSSTTTFLATVRKNGVLFWANEQTFTGGRGAAQWTGRVRCAPTEVLVFDISLALAGDIALNVSFVELIATSAGMPTPL